MSASAERPASRAEAAEYFGKTIRTIDVWIRLGFLRSEKIGGSVYIDRESMRLFKGRTRAARTAKKTSP